MVPSPLDDRGWSAWRGEHRARITVSRTDTFYGFGLQFHKTESMPTDERLQPVSPRESKQLPNGNGLVFCWKGQEGRGSLARFPSRGDQTLGVREGTRFVAFCLTWHEAGCRSHAMVVAAIDAEIVEPDPLRQPVQPV